MKIYFDTTSQVLMLGLRNLLRNKRRTLLTILSLVIGLWGVILIDGFVSYSMWGLGETVIHSGTSHLQVVGGEKFFTEGNSDPFPFMITDSIEVIKKISAMPEVRQVVPSITFQALLQGKNGSENIMVVALPPEDASENLSFRSIEEGRDLQEGERDTVVLGRELAKKMGVEVGQTVHMLSAMKGGGVNMLDVEVVGLSMSGIAAYDAVVSYLSLDNAKELLLVDDVPQLLVFLEDTKDTDGAYARISSDILPGYGSSLAIRKWYDLSDYYEQASGTYGVILLVAKAIIILVAIFVIMNTVSMAVFERIREIGTLRSLGTTKRRVMGMFMAEGFFLGVIGSGAGIAAGLATCSLLNLAGGVSFPAQPGMSVALTIFFKPDTLGIATLPLISLPATLLGTVFPAMRAVKLQITESLRAA